MAHARCESVVSRKVMIAVGFFAFCASAVFAESSKIAKDLRGISPTDHVTVIVQFTKIPSVKQHQKITSKGGKLNRELEVVKAASYSVPASALAVLAADPEVVYITPERPLF